LSAGLEAYFAMEFSKALEHFSQGNEMDLLDKVFELYKTRSLEYIQNNPGENWKGFEQMKHK
jgi:hypothetical protein